MVRASMLRKFVLLSIVGMGGACGRPPPAAPTKPIATTSPKHDAKSGGAPIAAGGASLRWHVVLGRHLELTEEVCWAGFAPGHVRPDLPTARSFARATTPTSMPLPIDDVGVRAEATTGCIRLAMNLEQMARSLDDDAALVRVGESVYGSLDTWLWRPDVWPEGLRGTLRVDAPDDVSVSLPHQRAPDGTYEVPLSTYTFMTRAALGHFVTDEFDAHGARIAVVNLTTSAISREGVRQSIAQAAKAVASIDGRLPSNHVQILLLPGWDRQHEPVQFGMAMRGGGAAVMLRVSPSATDRTLFGEWIATHELSHLWMPPILDDSIWLSEGFASYYQCILRSRVGIYDEARAWSELLSGFERGRAHAGDLPLESARPPSYQHIYWGGAALLFKLDVEMRRQGQSLDSIVSRTRRSIWLNDQERSVDLVLSELERAANYPLGQTVRRWREQPFVDTSEELRALGISRVEGVAGVADRVVLDDRAPLATIRRAIAAPRSN